MSTTLTGILTGISGSESRELVQIVEVWGSLPGEIKEAILAIVSPYQLGGKQ